VSEPTKSGDKPIPESAVTGDKETIRAEKEWAEREAAIAEEHLLPDDAEQMTREEYDRIGKGPDYEPHNTDNTFGVEAQKDAAQRKTERAEDKAERKTSAALAKEQRKDERQAADAPVIDHR
jgi:hypothetical protein